MNTNPWYFIQNADEIDSPALVVYPDRVEENIALAIRMARGSERLRPHVKTCKIAEVCVMMRRAGISRFKCATIAEADMLGMSNAPDVLMAYQPVGPKIRRFASLAETYPDTRFSCLTDNEAAAREINRVFSERKRHTEVYIDLNIGMNRTGLRPEDATALADEIETLPSLTLRGVHAYDGHIHDPTPSLRKRAGDQAFAIAEQVLLALKAKINRPLRLVVGGTPTFPVHAGRPEVECSPGTFVFWDWGYSELLADQPFRYAALVLSRVVSVIDARHICLDLGHKSVAAENPLPRVHFLNAPQAIPQAQSEEHLVVEVKDSTLYPVGTLFYGVPVHICPTVALYEKAHLINKHNYTGLWRVIARDKAINL